MEIAILIVSILLIAIVLLQSGKAEDAAQIMTGGSENLFQNRKERGGELFITAIYYESYSCLRSYLLMSMHYCTIVN